MEAVRDGNVQRSRDLINAGDPEDGCSVLIVASGKGRIQSVQALIEAQVDVNYANPAYGGDPKYEGDTAL